MHGLQAHFVLHARPYANSSLLLELLSSEGARYPAIAKGVKHGRGPSAALLQPFRPVLLELRGRGEVLTLGKLEAGGSAYLLSGDALYCGLYVNELLVRLLGRNDAHEGLFALYCEVLARLAGGREIQLGLRRFELGLLRHLGYGLPLDREAETGAPVRPDGRYRYRIEAGPEPSAATAPEAETLAGATLLALARGEPLPPQGLVEARRLMRRVLDHYLDGRPLRSRELFRHGFRRPGHGLEE
jgi:DNA repair protein RecO (recombination protein O)